MFPELFVGHRGSLSSRVGAVAAVPVVFGSSVGPSVGASVPTGPSVGAGSRPPLVVDSVSESQWAAPGQSQS